MLRNLFDPRFPAFWEWILLDDDLFFALEDASVVFQESLVEIILR